MAEKSPNSLSAAIAGNLAEQDEAPAKPPRKRVAAANDRDAKRTSKKAKTSTVLVGGHFPPGVLKQLRIIAAEEETTNQALIGEALDLLFAKKGKAKIENL